MKTSLKIQNQIPSKQFKSVKPKTRSFARVADDLFTHIMQEKDFSSQEKIYYLQHATSKNNKTKFSTKKQASLFGCSVRKINTCQNKFEKKGYLKITKTKFCNIVQATLPKQVFENLRQKDTIRAKHEGYNPKADKYLEHLKNTSMFVDYDSQFLRDLYDANITPSCKLLFIEISRRAYKYYKKSGKASILITAKNLIEATRVTEKTLYKNIRLLEEEGYITKEGKNKKGIWKITINEEKNILRSGSKNYPQKEAKKFDFSSKKCIASTVKSAHPIYTSNNKDKENKTKVITEEEIVDKSKDFPTITVNEVVSNIFEEKIRKEKVSNKTESLSEDPFIKKSSRRVDLKDRFSNQATNSDCQIRQKILDHFGKHCYTSWFSKIRFDEVTKNKMTISAPNKFFKNYIQTHYLWDLEKIFSISNSCFEIQIKVDENLKKMPVKCDSFFVSDQQKEDNKPQECLLTKEQTKKVANYASKLCDQNLRRGYSYLLSKEELTKQMMYHAKNWRPTSNPNLSQEDGFEVSLLVAYKKVKEGLWCTPKGFYDASGAANENKV